MVIKSMQTFALLVEINVKIGDIEWLSIALACCKSVNYAKYARCETGAWDDVFYFCFVGHKFA